MDVNITLKQLNLAFLSWTQMNPRPASLGAYLIKSLNITERDMTIARETDPDKAYRLFKNKYVK